MSDPYRLLVTGSRDWDDEESVRFEIAGMTMCHAGLVIVHGACPTGADSFAAKVARDVGIRQEPHPADWQKYGKSAGYRRNAEMVALGADACVAFIRGGSRGATHCADLAEKAGIPVLRLTA
jgi:hypothetical protein